jgi:hypothetical protein
MTFTIEMNNSMKNHNCLSAFVFLLAAGILFFVNCAFHDLSKPDDDIILIPDYIKITEVMTSNSSSFYDQFGETPDWIELYNSGDSAIDLAGYTLTDNPDQPEKWTCGSQILNAGAYTIICASGKDITAFAPESTEVIDMMNTAISPWADSQNIIAGKSHVRPVMFPGKVFGVVDGKKIISAQMYLNDNSHILNWQAAQISMKFFQTKDYSSFDRIRITGTIEKGKPFMVRICQDGVEDWLTFGLLLTGTGKENDLYDIPIANEPRLNRAAVTGFMFAANQVNDSITIAITGLTLVKTPSYMHANFKLSSDGETLAMSNRRGELIARHELKPLLPDLSEGSKQGDLDTWVVFNSPSPGRANDALTFAGIVKPVTASLHGGFYTSPVRITLTNPLTDIFYTTDGSIPTIFSTRYTQPFTIDTTAVLRYRGFSNGLAPGALTTTTFFINEKSDLAIISITADPAALFDPDTGIYMMGPRPSDTFPYFGANFWLDKEIPVHIEFFEPNGALGFTDGAGLRIFGNYSRANPKKSLAIVFKNRYGNGSLSYPLFPDYSSLTKFQSFILRNNGGNFQRAMFEDALAGVLSTGLDIDFQKYRPSTVFINGRYWGILNIREKLNTGYIEGNHGYAPDQVDFIKAYGDLEAGDKNHYNDMLHYLKSYDMRLTEHYDYIATQMDIDNFITYMTCEIYYANTDWPANNNGWWRPKTATGKWRWIIYDVDGGFGSWGQAYDTNMIAFATDSLGPEWPNPPWSTFILRTLLKNAGFKRRFINRAATLLSANFETSTVIAKIESMAAAIRSEIPRDFARWGQSESRWESSVTGLKNWAQYRPDGLRKNYTEFFSLSGTARLTLAVQGRGGIDIDGFTPSMYPFTGVYFKGNPVLITAVSGTGTFKQWSDGVAERVRMVEVSEDITLTALFE